MEKTIDNLKNRGFIKDLRETDSQISKEGFNKNYDSKKKALFIQSDDKSEMISMELKSSYCKGVAAGKSVLIADIKLKDWKGRNTLFDNLGFYNEKSSYQKIDKKFIYKYAEEITIESSIYIPEIGENVPIDIQVADWDNAVEFTNLSELPHKDIWIGIFTKTTFGEKVEWLPTVNSFDIYEWAAYDCSLIAFLEHDPSIAGSNSVAMIDSTHFMLAYSGVDNDGFIKTFSIDGNYENITQIHSVEHDIGNGTYNSLIKIDATHYMLSYYGAGGWLKVFTINGSYQISETSSLKYDNVRGAYGSLVMIDDTHFILVFSGDGDDGFIKTFSINPGDSYAITELASLEHDATKAQWHSMVKIDATHFIFAHSNPARDGGIKTISIDGNYENITVEDSVVHDTGYGEYNALTKIDETHFALAYMGSIDPIGGWIKIFSIDGNYDITEESSLEHDAPGAGIYNSIITLDSTHIIIVYAGNVGYDGIIKVFSIDPGSSYAITEETSLTYDTEGRNTSFVQIDDTHFFLGHSGAGSDGYVRTFSMEAPAVSSSSSSSSFSSSSSSSSFSSSSSSSSFSSSCSSSSFSSSSSSSSFSSSSRLVLINNSTNVVIADTDTNLCIYDIGSGVAIKNRLGSTLTVRVQLNYS